jgi:S1-C subfamily serine protease
MSQDLIDLSNTLAQLTARAAASVVAVHTESRGSSSGIVWRSGIIVTSEHALRRDEEIQVTPPTGRVTPATLVGRDPDLTGVYGSSESERESLLRRAGHADKEVQAGADRDVAAAD